MMGALGTGNFEEGIVTISMGTSGNVYLTKNTPFLDQHGEISSFCHSINKYLPLICLTNMSNG